VDGLRVKGVWLGLSAQNSSARRPLSLVEKLVKVTAGVAPALEQNKAEQRLRQPKRHTVSTPVKREPNEVLPVPALLYLRQ